MISSMGVDKLWITGAQRVERAYWSSHLLRPENEAKMRALLVEGLVQSGDPSVPRLVVAKNLKRLLRDDALNFGQQRAMEQLDMPQHS